MRGWRFAAAIVIAGISSASVARAEPPWVDRHVTLPERDWAFDFGLGIAHEYAPPTSPTGVGLNIEGAVSPIDRLEIGLRTGVRLGTEARETRADNYGRLFDRQTFGVNNDTVANPEFRIRGAILRGAVAEIGLEGRAYLPIEVGSEFGMMFGLPLLFHIGHRVRLDTGAYVPVIFTSPVDSYFSAPVDVWIQATGRLWLGPMSGVVFHSRDNHVDVPLGFGLGYQILRTLDLKTQILFPEINQTQGAQTFGVGVGIQVRIE